MFNKYPFNTAQFNEEPVVIYKQCGNGIVLLSGIIKRYINTKLTDTVRPEAMVLKSSARQAGLVVMLLTGSIARRTKPQMGKAVIALAGQKQRTTTKAVSGNVISTAGIIRSIDKVTGKAECALSSTLTKLGLFWVTAGNATITPITLVKRAVNKKIENTVEYIDRLLKYSTKNISDNIEPTGSLAERFNVIIPAGGFVALSGQLASKVIRGYQIYVGNAVIMLDTAVKKITRKVISVNIQATGSLIRIWRIKIGKAVISPINVLTKNANINTGKAVATPTTVFDKVTIKRCGYAVVKPIQFVTKKLWFSVGDATVFPVVRTLKEFCIVISDTVTMLGNVKAKQKTVKPPEEKAKWLKLSRFLHALKDPYWR